MNKTIIAAFLLLTAVTSVSVSHADNPPPCSPLGDKDLDGVPDADDSDETDSCLLSSSGHEDCVSGAGDGIPDCA